MTDAENQWIFFDVDPFTRKILCFLCAERCWPCNGSLSTSPSSLSLSRLTLLFCDFRWRLLVFTSRTATSRTIRQRTIRAKSRRVVKHKWQRGDVMTLCECVLSSCRKVQSAVGGACFTFLDNIRTEDKGDWSLLCDIAIVVGGRLFELFAL